MLLLSQAIAWIVWLLPILVVPLSYLTYRYLPFRSVRYIASIPFFVAAFVLDLNGISFRNDLVDTIGCFLLTFVLFEWIWHLKRLKRRFWIRSGLALGIVGIVMGNFDWIAAGPAGITHIYQPNTVFSTQGESDRYYVKDYPLNNPLRTIRTISIRRIIKGLPLEKELDHYKVPRDYSRTAFSYQWGRSAFGPKVDLIDPPHVIWSLGEGL